MIGVILPLRPQGAAYLNSHPVLKPVVRLALYPAVAYSRMAIEGWLVSTLLPLTALIVVAVRRRRQTA